MTHQGCKASSETQGRRELCPAREEPGSGVQSSDRVRVGETLSLQQRLLMVPSTLLC